MLRHDLQTIMRIGHEAANAPDLARFREYALEAAHELIATDFATYNEIDHGQNQVHVLTSPPELMQEATLAAFKATYDEHPLIRYYAETNDGRAKKISDFLDQESFHRLELYRTVFAPHGLEYQIAITLPAPPTHLIGIALNRRKPDFSEQEREVLNLLRPLLAQAYRQVEERDALRRRLDGLEIGLAHTSEGIILLSPTGTIDYASPRAQELLELTGPELADTLEAWLADKSSRPLLFRHLTLQFVGERELGVLLVSESRTLPAASLLTPRELELLASVADGHTDQQVAAQLGVSVRTIQHHLANIFNKLGVHNRTAAARRVFGYSKKT